ncbi:response regulator [Pelagovum pacificum]|nr:response regulator [Pelagovum pacificum]QQA43521.1 response regulator [Pelagovum pacificum]
MTHTILHIDDDPIACELVRSILEDAFEVRVVSRMNTSDALETLKQVAPDLIITDIAMPGHGGFELVRALRDTPSTAAIPIIVLSGRIAMLGHYEQFQDMVDDILEKPIHQAELRAKVRRTLKLH